MCGGLQEGEQKDEHAEQQDERGGGGLHGVDCGVLNMGVCNGIKYVGFCDTDICGIVFTIKQKMSVPQSQIRRYHRQCRCLLGPRGAPEGPTR